MISRLMLSLKKAADTRQVGWEVTTTTFTPYQGGKASKRLRSIRFAPPPGERATTLSTEGEIHLATVPSSMAQEYA